MNALPIFPEQDSRGLSIAVPGDYRVTGECQASSGGMTVTLLTGSILTVRGDDDDVVWLRWSGTPPLVSL